MLIAPGNLFWAGQFVGIDDGCDPCRVIVKKFIDPYSAPLSAPVFRFTLTAGKSVSSGQTAQKSMPSAKVGVFAVWRIWLSLVQENPGTPYSGNHNDSH